MTYQMRAYFYIKAMFEYVNNWRDLDDIIEATDKVFWHTGKQASVECGSARIVIVGEDFAVKWDYDFENIEEIGGCEDEFRVYKRSLSTGYAHLLAPVFRIYHRNRFFFIMPRVDRIGPEEHEYKDINEFITEDEYNWLRDNIGDLHGWNWGFIDGKPTVIDYACNPNNTPYSE